VQMSLEATDTVNGKKWAVDPVAYATDDRIQQASVRPDMILQLCHHIAGELRRTSGHRVEIRARVVASLNDRPPQYLIDPNVDLASQPRTLGHVHWIVPLLERK